MTGGVYVTLWRWGTNSEYRACMQIEIEINQNSKKQRNQSEKLEPTSSGGSAIQMKFTSEFGGNRQLKRKQSARHEWMSLCHCGHPNGPSLHMDCGCQWKTENYRDSAVRLMTSI